MENSEAPNPATAAAPSGPLAGTDPTLDALAPPTPPTPPLRAAFAGTGLGKGLAALALLALLAARQLMASERTAAVLLALGGLFYLAYFLWARGAKVETQVLTGMDAVRESERSRRRSS